MPGYGTTQQLLTLTEHVSGYWAPVPPELRMGDAMDIQQEPLIGQGMIAMQDTSAEPSDSFPRFTSNFPCVKFNGWHDLARIQATPEFKELLALLERTYVVRGFLLTGETVSNGRSQHAVTACILGDVAYKNTGNVTIAAGQDVYWGFPFDPLYSHLVPHRQRQDARCQVPILIPETVFRDEVIPKFAKQLKDGYYGNPIGNPELIKLECESYQNRHFVGRTSTDTEPIQIGTVNMR